MKTEKEKDMAVPAALLLAAIASAGAQGFSASQQARAQNEAAELSREQLQMTGRQHRDAMRLRRKQQKSAEQTSAVNMLAGIEGLRQETGKPTNADFLSQFAG